jgi:response regulator RpfG family c-di-GMP phosphodiesterase
MPIDKSMNVLIVDDYKTMLRIIRNLLKQIELTMSRRRPMAPMRSPSCAPATSAW